jgi:hypothetical protein
MKPSQIKKKLEIIRKNVKQNKVNIVNFIERKFSKNMNKK